MKPTMNEEEFDKLCGQFGGKIKLTVIVQKRLRELSRGAVPLVETESTNLIDVALEEIVAGKIGVKSDAPLVRRRR